MRALFVVMCLLASSAFAQDRSNTEKPYYIPDPPNMISEISYGIEHCTTGDEVRKVVDGKTICGLKNLVCEHFAGNGPSNRTVHKYNAFCVPNASTNRCPSPGVCLGDTKVSDAEVEKFEKQVAAAPNAGGVPAPCTGAGPGGFGGHGGPGGPGGRHNVPGSFTKDGAIQ